MTDREDRIAWVCQCGVYTSNMQPSFRACSRCGTDIRAYKIDAMLRVVEAATRAVVTARNVQRAPTPDNIDEADAAIGVLAEAIAAYDKEDDHD